METVIHWSQTKETILVPSAIPFILVAANLWKPSDLVTFINYVYGTYLPTLTLSKARSFPILLAFVTKSQLFMCKSTVSKDHMYRNFTLETGGEACKVV